MSTELTDLDREIIDIAGKYISSNNGIINIEFENELLARIKGKILHPKSLELLGERVTNNGSLIAVGIAMIRAYKHHIDTGNELAFQASVDVYSRFYVNTPTDVKQTLRSVQSDLGFVLEKLKDPFRLRMIVGEIQLRPEHAVKLLQYTAGMDDIIIDAIDLSKGLIDVKSRVTIRNGDELEIFDKSPLNQLLAMTLQKDPTGELFKKTASAIIECQDITFTSFQVSDLLAIHRHQIILSALHGGSENSLSKTVLDFIKTKEDAFFEMQIVRNKISMLMSPMVNDQLKFNHLERIPFEDLRLLIKAGSFLLADKYASACYLSSLDGETVYDLHELVCNEESLSSEVFVKVLSNTLDKYATGSRYSEMNMDKIQFIQYASDHGIIYTAEQLSKPSNYIRQLARQYAVALNSKDFKKTQLYEFRIQEDLSNLTSRFLDNYLNFLRDEIPPKLMENKRIRMYEISNDFEI